MKTKTTRYYATGSVRGHCGHEHYTLTGLARCMVKDRRACKMQGGYSDLSGRAVDGDGGRRLDEYEFNELEQLIENGGRP